MRAGKGWIDRTFIDLVLGVIRMKGKFALHPSRAPSRDVAGVPQAKHRKWL